MCRQRYRLPLCLISILQCLCFLGTPADIITTSSLFNQDRNIRALSLTANRIVCAEAASNPGDLCGGISLANYTTSDATNYLYATNFKNFLQRSPLYGVQEYVIKYKTKLRKDGPPINATGIVALPSVEGVKAPIGGFPIVVWNHFTVGVGDDFAPSETALNQTNFVSIALMSFLRNYPSNGFILVAPDYAGLGVPEYPHYYLVKKPTAYSIIDSVQAAIALAKSQGIAVSTTTIFFGHSQGGSAVLQAQEVYDGPEKYGKQSFDLKAVVSSAPAPTWRFAFHDTYTFYNQRVAADVGLYFWAASKYNNNLSLSELLSPAAISTLDSYAEILSSNTLESGNYFPSNVTDYLSSSTGVRTALQSNIIGFNCYLNSSSCLGVSSPYNLSAMSLSGLSMGWQNQFDEDSPGSALISTVPVLLVQGSADTVVQPYYTIMLAQKITSNGVPLVDSSGKAIDLSSPLSIAHELKTASNCTSKSQIITCGLTHSTVALDVDLYAPFMFSKAGILQLQVLPMSTATVVGGRYIFAFLSALALIIS